MNIGHYNISGEKAYEILTGDYRLTMIEANSLILLAESFETVHVPHADGGILAVSFKGGYYHVEMM